MNDTLPKPALTVNARPWLRLLRTQALIWGVFGGAALLMYLSGLEQALALALYNDDLNTTLGALAWDLRTWGAAIPGYIAGLALLMLLVPKLWQRRPTLYQCCAVMVLAALFGAGLINQVVVQELTDRHRPRETVLVGKMAHDLPAELNGHSMPSGHAGMAFVLAAPAFALRRRHPRAAAAVLAAGVAWGFIVGGGRMVLGAHFFSDVLVAGAITLSVAALAAVLMARFQRISPWLMVGGAAVAVAALVLGNAFKLSLTMPLAEPLPIPKLPCVVERVVVEDASLTQPELHVALRGFGAPLSQLRLVQQEGVISLARGYGVFHSLKCSAQLRLPTRFE